jgi:hypothetical protein
MVQKKEITNIIVLDDLRKELKDTQNGAEPYVDPNFVP